jgi:hypothetical protein
MKPLAEHCCAGSGASKRTFVRPFTHRGLDEAFSLAVRARGVRTSANVTNAEMLTKATKRARKIRGSIVRHYALDTHAAIGKPRNSSLHKRRSRVCTLVLKDLDICNARSVIDANVGEFPTAPTMIGLTAAISGNSMANTVLNPTQFLDVDVHEFAGLRAFVTDYRFTRVQAIESRNAALLCDTSNGSSAAANFRGNAIVGPALPAQPLHSHFHFIGHRRWHFIGPRRAIGHAAFTLESIPLNPLEDRRPCDSQGLGNVLGRFAPFKPPHDRQPAALRQLSVLMAHHAKFSQEATAPHLREGVRNLLRDHT